MFASLTIKEAGDIILPRYIQCQEMLVLFRCIHIQKNGFKKQRHTLSSTVVSPRGSSAFMLVMREE
jgi:hypothetical protein